MLLSIIPALQSYGGVPDLRGPQRPGLQKPKPLKEQTLTTGTRKLAKACGGCVYNGRARAGVGGGGGQLTTVLQAGLRNVTSITGIGPDQRDHETQFPGSKVLPLGLDGFWSGCPKAPGRERRSGRGIALVTTKETGGPGFWLCRPSHLALEQKKKIFCMVQDRVAMRAALGQTSLRNKPDR